MKSLIKSIVIVGMLVDTTIIVAKAKRGPSQEDYYSTAERDLPASALRKADALTVKTIAEIKALVNRKSTSKSQKFELLLRLGELHAERHDYLRDSEMLAYEAKHDAWIAKKKKGKSPSLNISKSQSELQKSVTAFRKLVRQYPKHPRSADAMYSLGKTLSRLGDDNSVSYFKKLIQYHPKHNLVADSYLAIGDYYFEKNRANSALEYYKKLSKYKSHPSYPYGIYKLGWSFYNSSYKNSREEKKNIKGAINSFKLVVELSKKDKQIESGRIDLNKEALGDLVMVWSETEDVNDAWAYFSRLDNKNAFYKVLDNLGKSYVKKGRNSDAIKVYERLLDENPENVKAFSHHDALIKLYEKTSQITKATQSLMKMSNNFMVNSTWLIRNRSQKALLSEVQKGTEFNLRHYSTLFHKRAQKSKIKVYSKSALTLYEEYLKRFVKNSHEMQIRFYLADLQLDSKMYIQASKNFVDVSNGNVKKLKENAAKNAVIAVKAFDDDKKHKVPSFKTLLKEPTPLPKSKELLVKVIENYTGKFPKSKETPKMKFTVMSLYFGYGDYKKAEPLMDALINSGANNTRGDSALKMRLALEEKRQNWKSLEALTRKFAKLRPKPKKKTRTLISDLMKVSVFNQALALEKSGQAQKAGNMFMAYQKEFKSDWANAPKALFNAASNYFKSGSLEKAIEAHKILSKDYTKSKLARDSLITVADSYNALADFKNAAIFYEKFAKFYPNDAKASTALFNAATLRKGIGDKAKSVELFVRFTKKYPKSHLAGSATMEMAEISEARGKNSLAAKYYGNFAKIRSKAITQEQKILAQAKAAQLGRGTKSAMRSLKKALLKKNSPDAIEARRIVAAYEFGNLSKDLKGFKKFNIKGLKNLERNIIAEQKKLEKLAGKLEKVMDLGSPEYHVASLYSLGELHVDFAQKLFAIDFGKGVSESEKIKLKSSIDQLALPLREQGYKYFETAAVHASEVETFSPWTEKAYDKLVQLGRNEYKTVDEQSTSALYMTHAMDLSKRQPNTALAH